MAEKFIELQSGEFVENEGLVQSTGVSDAGKLVATDTDGRLSASVMPIGYAPEVKVLVASEALSAGDLINVWNDGGTEKARKADASNNYKAHGFVQASVSLGQNAEVYVEGINTNLTGLTPGADLYLGATAGETTETAPSTSGHTSQRVGTALSATEASFEPARSVLLA